MDEPIISRPASIGVPADAPLGGRDAPSQREQRRVVFASSLGTVFEWYDFYLYASLTPFFASLH